MKTKTPTPTKQEMLDKIYEVIANKELSFWCEIIYEWTNYKINWESWWYWYDLYWWAWSWLYLNCVMLDNSQCNWEIVDYKIIGHYRYKK